jgi:rubrerythrin
MADKPITRDQLAQLLNEDLSREYQAIIAYVVYSQVLKGAEYMNIADQLEQHAHQELQHALTISRQIDYLGKMPSVTPKPVKISEKPHSKCPHKPLGCRAPNMARSTIGRSCRKACLPFRASAKSRSPMRAM